MTLNEEDWHPDKHGKYHYEAALGLLLGNDGRHKGSREQGVEELILAIECGDLRAKRTLAVHILEEREFYADSEIIKAFERLVEVYNAGDEESLELVRKYILLQPSDFLLKLGSKLYKEREYDFASAALVESHAKGNMSAAHVLGNVYKIKGEYGKAIEWLRMSISEGNQDSRRELAWALLLENFEQNHCEATAIFDKIRKEGDSEGEFGLGYIEERLGNPNDALNHYYNSAVRKNEKAKEKVKLEALKNNSKAAYFYSDLVSGEERYKFLLGACLLGNRTAFKRLMNESGNKLASQYLGTFFEYCEQYPEHAELALKWYDRSGTEDSRIRMKIVVGRKYNTEEYCPYCHVKLRIIRGENGGYFKGCPNYPGCGYTTNTITNIYRTVGGEYQCFDSYKVPDNLNLASILDLDDYRTDNIVSDTHSESKGRFIYYDQEHHSIYGDGFER